MVNKTKQNWTVGSKVNIGFLRGLTVIKIVATPGDYKPDLYVLRADNGSHYQFVPHNGINKIADANAHD